MSVSNIQVAAEAEGLPDLLDRVERGEEITITRRGRPVVRLVPAPATHDDAGQAAVDDLFQLREMLAAQGVGPFTVLDIVSAIHEGRKY